MELEKRRMQLKLERLLFDLETNCFGEEDSKAKQVGSARVVIGRARSPDLHHFIDENDNLDSYLLQFKRYAIVANWLHANWVTH